jgi:hypothetical protein
MILHAGECSVLVKENMANHVVDFTNAGNVDLLHDEENEKEEEKGV